MSILCQNAITKSVIFYYGFDICVVEVLASVEGKAHRIEQEQREWDGCDGNDSIEGSKHKHINTYSHKHS